MIYWIFITVSSILFIVSAGVAIHNHSWLTGAQSVKGVVIELIEERGKKGKVTYAPKVSYEINGHTSEFVSSQSSNPPDFKVGQEVSVAVNIEKNKRGIATFGEIYGFPLFGGLISITILIGVIVIMNGTKILKLIYPNLG